MSSGIAWTEVVMNDDNQASVYPNVTLQESILTNNTNVHESGRTKMSPQLIGWGWLSVVLLCLAIKPSIPDARYRRGEQARERHRQREEARNDPEKRKKLINDSLITKRVLSCDDEGTLTLGDTTLDGQHVEEFSYSSMDDEDSNACVICLEPFRVGDDVTWSRDMECHHVFHRDCIHHWLQDARHDDCPSCRSHIIHSEDISDSDSDDEEHVASPPSSNLAFVIINGLVSYGRRASYSLVGSSIETTRRSFRKSTPDISEPLRLRRVRSEGPHVGRKPSLLRVALRRVSSGMYSQLANTFDSDADDDKAVLDFVRQTCSEGDDNLRSVPSFERPLGIQRAVSADFQIARRDRDLDSLEPPPQGLFAAGRVSFRRASSDIYARFSSTFDSADPKECDDEDLDEDDLVEAEHFWRIKRGNVTDVDEHDVELGTVQAIPSL